MNYQKLLDNIQRHLDVWGYNALFRETGIPLQNKHPQVFLYFDYEREFGAPINIEIDISIILDILKKNNIKATWFTVGKIFERYPSSIEQLINTKQSIGSHSYEHNPLLLYKNYNMIDQDLKKWKECSKHYNLGPLSYHSPQNRLSYNLIKALCSNGFQHIVISSVFLRKEGSSFITFRFHRKQNKLYQIPMIGDDWLVYTKKLSPNDQIKKFEDIIAQSNKTYAIGFHPWILLSDKTYLNYFSDLINMLKKHNIDLITFDDLTTNDYS